MNNYEIKELLKNAIEKNKVLHSYMFIGNKLTQKDEAAIDFAQQVLCLSKENLHCEECKSCVEIKNNNHPDFAKVDLEEDVKSIKIEQIRKLQEDIMKKPIISDKKVYIIKYADKMTVRSTELFIKNIRRTTRICYHNFISRK